MNNLERYIDHEVIDQNGNRIGTLNCLWSDQTGQPAYLGIQTGWLFGKTHVVPAYAAEVTESNQKIRLPYTEQMVKDAPAYEANSELTDQVAREVNSYYRINPSRPSPAQTGSRQEEARIQLSEEELKVGKRQVEAGGVRLRKVIRTQTVNQPVELRREEIVIERVPGQPGQKSQADAACFQDQEIYIPLRREEPVVQKENYVREEVRVSKKSKAEQRTVSEQVRKEDIEVQGGNAAPRPSPARAAQPQTRPQTSATNKAVFGIVRDRQQASRVVDQLKAAGFSSDDVSVLLSDKTSTRDFAHEKNTKAPEGAATGAATGGLLGGALGWLAGVGALAIPGAGPFIAAGPLMAALGGGAIGAGAGGLVGALVGLGIPEYEAKRYEGKLREGHILVSVHSENGDETRRAKEILECAGAEDIAAKGEEKASELSNQRR